MKEKILGAFLMLLLPAVCSAGEEPAMKPQKQSDANITGHVVDAKTYEHLAFATIAVKGTTIGIATDATGHYFLKNLPQAVLRSLPRLWVTGVPSRRSRSRPTRPSRSIFP